MPKRRRNPAPDPFGGINELFADVLENFARSVSMSIQNPVLVNNGIPPEMFRKLISLCHPDKHNNSETSQEVTRWLLKQREER